MPSATANVTWNCEIVSKEILDWVEVCMLRRKISKQNCQQIPGYYRWIEDSKLSADTRILWIDRGSKLKGNCLVIGKVSEPCDKIRVRNKRKKIEEVCQNTTETMTMEEWKTIWGPSLLETYSYLGKVNWCIVWEGKKNQDFGQKSLFKEQYRKKVEMMELWNCTQVLTCDTPPVQIGLEPVRVLLQWGCECRGYNHTLAKKEKEPWDCKTTTVRSPGNLVWVMGHGLWTTHMPIYGAVTQITLGVPTLCPFWKTSKLQEKELVSRKKREIEDDASIQEDWHEPDDGVKVGWMLESLFAPISSYRNREMLYRLLGQTERLAATTKKGFRDLNLQLQATTRMTLQNRMALDLLLLKEHGVCGYLRNRVDHCCVHIPNVTEEIEKDIDQLEQIESKTKELQKDAEHNWVGALLSSLGIQVSGWVSSIIQYAIMFVIVIIVVIIVYRCLLGMILKEGAHTKRVIQAVTRREVIQPRVAETQT
ncbi:hypothetical protein DUI87_13480 [Hirundo rustica rustica]|uniref:Envelope glycoprotein n=1 Tax=Hirundo rustica rustica TaxID=333673 RepID=A0A3M0KEQ0_HIRRU|nr:hypothetical protein DUI87_13480 [Hirundo rustica rustica]